MKFMEIVETVESIETKLSALSEAKLALLETILEEGAETQFDVEYHIDYLVEFIESQSDENATTIAESVNGGQVLDIILEAARKHTNDKESFIAEAVEKVGNQINTDLADKDPLFICVLNGAFMFASQLWPLSPLPFYSSSGSCSRRSRSEATRAA